MGFMHCVIFSIKINFFLCSKNSKTGCFLIIRAGERRSGCARLVEGVIGRILGTQRKIGSLLSAIEENRSLVL